MEKHVKPYQICTRCIMDTTDPNIVFDSSGICNHCTEAIKRLNLTYFKTQEEKDIIWSNTLSKIKADKQSEYDCIIGLSGGVDSSYLAYLIKQWDLKPLAVHVDNGWNSEISVKNIENIVKKLNFDLYTLVLDWEEFKNLQIAFLKSSVIDLEMLSDNAIGAGIYKIAKKYKIKHFLAGTNIATEAILPEAWCNWAKTDSLNIRAIFKKYGTGQKLLTYPLLNFFEFINYTLQNKLIFHSPLDYVQYDKSAAKAIIQQELGWQDYGGKHHESRITKFYQAYILPHKFNVDKRKAHLSNLICSGQITREEAMMEIEKPLYDLNMLKVDKEFFIKKLEFTEEDFKKIMSEDPVPHSNFHSYMKIIKPLNSIRRKIWKRSDK